MALEIIRGDDVTINVTFKDMDGAAMNITDYTAFFTVKIKGLETASDTNAIMQDIVTSHTNAVAGQTQFVLDHNQTTVPAGKYRYDLQLVKDGQVVSTQSDKFTVLQDVTQRIS